MLAEVLNRQFLLDAAAVVRSDLVEAAGAKERRGSLGPLDQVTGEQIREVADELRRLLLQQSADSRSPEGRAAKDHAVYMPREPLLAILQTVIEEVVEEQRPEVIAQGAPGEGRRSGGGGAVGADRHLTGLDLPGSADDERRAFGRFEVTKPKIFSDPRWALSGVVILWHRFKKDKAAFGGLPTAPVTVADDARIVMVGDWGSGTPRARAVAAQMRVELDAGIATGREQHVVHMGDVYYTGSQKEYERYFLANWPVGPGEDIRSYNLAGNHDMYQGGHAYYERCLTDPRFAAQDGRSVFALRSGFWQFLGLDSSYDDEALHGDQAGWVTEQLTANPRHRTALLSHHQLFSAYEDGATQLGEQIGPVLDTGRIDAWFWAHEHRCLTYGPHRGVGFSSCIGHGGIPEYLVNTDSAVPGVPLKYEYRKQWGDGLEPWNTFGFAVLELDGPALHVRYVDEHGTQHHEEHLQA